MARTLIAACGSPTVTRLRKTFPVVPDAQRVFDARRAAQQGWRVRLCFDPIIVTDRRREHYTAAIEEVFRRMPPESVEEISSGVFRMHPDFLRRIQAFRSSESLVRGVQVGSSVAAYEDELREEVFAFMRDQLRKHMPMERVHPVHG